MSSTSTNMIEFNLYDLFIAEDDEINRLYPNQVKYRDFPPINAILKNREFTTLKILKYPLYNKEKQFKISIIPIRMFERFIELLPNSTMLLLPYTSKTMFQECLDIRGFNCLSGEERLETNAIFEYTLSYGYNGFLFNVWKMEEYRTKWIKFFVFRQRLQVKTSLFNFLRCTFVKKYKELEILCDNKMKDLQNLVFNLVIDGIETFHLFVDNNRAEKSTEKGQLSFEDFQYILNALKKCEKLKYFRCRFIGDNVEFDEKPTINQIKFEVDKWLSELPYELDIFYMYYNYKFYTIYNKKLMLIQENGEKLNSWFLVNIDDNENISPNGDENNNDGYKKITHEYKYIRYRNYNDFPLI